MKSCTAPRLLVGPIFVHIASRELTRTGQSQKIALRRVARGLAGGGIRCRQAALAVSKGRLNQCARRRWSDNVRDSSANSPSQSMPRSTTSSDEIETRIQSHGPNATLLRSRRIAPISVRWWHKPHEPLRLRSQQLRSWPHRDKDRLATRTRYVDDSRARSLCQGNFADCASYCPLHALPAGAIAYAWNSFRLVLVHSADARYSSRQSSALLQPPWCKSRAVTDSKPA